MTEGSDPTTWQWMFSTPTRPEAENWKCPTCGRTRSEVKKGMNICPIGHKWSEKNE